VQVNGGILPQTNGSPITAGSNFTGPLLAGPIPQPMGAMPNPPTLGGAGSGFGLADTGYCVMGQSAVVSQSAAAAPTAIVLPAQSQILRITLMVTVEWSGAADTFTVGMTGGTGADLVSTAAGTSIGQFPMLPSNAAEIALWDNVGNTQLQVTVTSANAGAGVGTLTVEYLQGINMAS
jgi:hypothetical protein